MHFSGHELNQLISAYGYWAVMLFVGVESIGFPFPGETMLLAAAIYAGTTHNLDIALVITAASFGAVLGDNIGYWFGREFGYELLLRYGRYFHFDQTKMKLGMYLFHKHGGKVVFFGRFVPVSRALAAGRERTRRRTTSSSRAASAVTASALPPAPAMVRATCSIFSRVRPAKST